MRLRLAASVLFLLLATVPSVGQGCAMCSLNAQAAGKQTQKALLRGVKVLLVPPIFFMGLIVGAAFLYKNRS